MWKREKSRCVVLVLRQEQLIDFRAVFACFETETDFAFGQFERVFELAPLEGLAVCCLDMPFRINEGGVLPVDGCAEDE